MYLIRASRKPFSISCDVIAIAIEWNETLLMSTAVILEIGVHVVWTFHGNSIDWLHEIMNSIEPFDVWLLDIDRSWVCHHIKQIHTLIIRYRKSGFTFHSEYGGEHTSKDGWLTDQSAPVWDSFGSEGLKYNRPFVQLGFAGIRTHIPLTKSQEQPQRHLIMP